MRLMELLKQAGVKESNDIESALAKAARDLYPVFQTDWSENDIYNFIMYIDFKQDEINKILNKAVKYGNLWAFS